MKHCWYRSLNNVVNSAKYFKRPTQYPVRTKLRFKHFTSRVGNGANLTSDPLSDSRIVLYSRNLRE